MALLAFLAVESGSHAREQLAALLWGESSEAKANASLRQALSSLRRLLGDHLSTTRTAVRLGPDVTSDVRTFLELVRTDPRAAAQIDVDRFLENITPRHCPPFDDWLDAVRGDLRARYCRCLATTGQEALARRAWQEAVTIGEQWCRVDPSSADATHLLVTSLYLSGDSSGALEAHDLFRTRSAAHPDTAPSPELCALISRITIEGPTAKVGGGNDSWQASALSGRFEAGLTGRSAEWEALGRVWTKTEQGSGAVVVAEGEMGAGKTRLADDFCRWVTTRGGQVLRARAYESGVTTPIGTMLGLLREAMQRPGIAGADPIALGIVARILPEVRRRFPAIVTHDSEPGTAVLEEAIADLLLALAEDEPLLIVVDDFHWCDPETGAMLHYLARRLDHARVVWYFAVALGHEEQDAPAIRIARGLRTLPGAQRLELAPLTRDEVLGIVRDLGRLRAPTTGQRLAQRVYDITQGNPFYVIELLKSWLAAGWFRADPVTGEWIVSNRTDFTVHIGTVSPTVHEAIAQRIARLPTDQQELLATIAAHHHGCMADVLSHVHGMSRLRISAVGEELEKRFFVGESDGRYGCAHPMIARVVLTSMGAARRRELHRAIALAMVQVAQDRGTEPDPGEVSYHADLGEEEGLAAEYALRASKPSDAPETRRGSRGGWAHLSRHDFDLADHLSHCPPESNNSVGCPTMDGSASAPLANGVAPR